MTRDYVIEQMAAKADISKKAAEDALRAFLDTLTDGLSKGDSLALTGFGTFQVSTRGARQGVNPRTGEKLQIPAMKVAKFKAGKALKDAVR
ncbi:MAG: DNA-binding protein HU [Candidatus Spechtbacteria bacterium RIFCSPHIGHO2_02_FULL_43_15b]|uniref:DNA-binding protein HU n=1 Tax=Candidatus Spechtbacteria bacterium RIFCSPHIGHO2_01_FULL_43_30 TaxID=1802158 RepID=A0A1G2H5L1_9BACT|nr:MAG: DNA-binding protein HU [Candidatus Spechtbacteria bacterium RIFCSPHIGHO2_01_FULL_43_30]OGZ59350.1 MAG: DNA-binding protein HU [Candidatus Spechtbacteria bacterium RIFCSPHIGHO2_02_FULL_43_15b]